VLAELVEEEVEEAELDVVSEADEVVGAEELVETVDVLKVVLDAEMVDEDVGTLLELVLIAAMIETLEELLDDDEELVGALLLLLIELEVADDEVEDIVAVLLNWM
jgi:hypothetical protein